MCLLFTFEIPKLRGSVLNSKIARQCIKKQRYHFTDKGSYSWSYDFSISHPVMYGCESWTMKRAECWIDAFELWCWRRLLRVPWTARASQPILKEINPEYSLEALMLKLKLQYFGHLMQRANSLEKTLMLGKFEGRRRREQQRMRWLDGISPTQGAGDGQGGLACCSPWGHRVGHDWATELNCEPRFCSTTKEATTMISPCPRMKSSTHSLQLEKVSTARKTVQWRRKKEGKKEIKENHIYEWLWSMMRQHVT